MNRQRRSLCNILRYKRLEQFSLSLKDQFTGERKKITPLVFIIKSLVSTLKKYPNFNSSIDEIEAAANQASLMEDIRGFPDGFDTLVGERGITLSGGQRQRAALGRALLLSSPVIVLDDALASVDNETAAAILTSIRKQQNRQQNEISERQTNHAEKIKII